MDIVEGVHARHHIFWQGTPYATPHFTTTQSLEQQRAALQQQDVLHATRSRTAAHKQHAANLEHQLDSCHRRLSTTHTVLQQQAQALERGCNMLQVYSYLFLHTVCCCIQHPKPSMVKQYHTQYTHPCTHTHTPPPHRRHMDDWQQHVGN